MHAFENRKSLNRHHSLAADAKPETNRVLEQLFVKWKAIRDMDLFAKTDIEADAWCSRYCQLNKAVLAVQAITARDVAIQYLVASDLCDSEPSFTFEQNMFALAGIPYIRERM